MSLYSIVEIFNFTVNYWFSYKSNYAIAMGKPGCVKKKERQYKKRERKKKIKQGKKQEKRKKEIRKRRNRKVEGKTK